MIITVWRGEGGGNSSSQPEISFSCWQVGGWRSWRMTEAVRRRWLPAVPPPEPEPLPDSDPPPRGSWRLQS